MNKRGSKNRPGTLISFFRAFGIALAAGAAFLLLICPAAFLFDDPNKAAPYFSLTALALFSFLGSRLLASTVEKNRLFACLLFGAATLLLLVGACFAFSLSLDLPLFGGMAAGVLLICFINGHTRKSRKPGHYAKRHG